MCGPKTGPNATLLRKSGDPPAMMIAWPASTMNPVKMKACRPPIAAAKNPPPNARIREKTSNIGYLPCAYVDVATTGGQFGRAGRSDGGAEGDADRTIAVYTSAYKNLTTRRRRV